MELSGTDWCPSMAATTINNKQSSNTPAQDPKQQLESDILQYLDRYNAIDNTIEWLQEYNSSHSNPSTSNTADIKSTHTIQHNELIASLRSLSSESLVSLSTSELQMYELTSDALSYLQHGTPEHQLFTAVSNDSNGTNKQTLEQQLGKDLVNIGQSQCMQQKWLKFDKATKSYIRTADAVTDTVKQQLQLIHDNKISSLDSKQIDNLKKRKMIVQSKFTLYSASKGGKFALQRRRIAHDLTSDMIRSGEWKNVSFKPYNLNSLGTPLQPGYLHPLMKVRTEFRSVLFGMGFSEMSTNQYVESSFWNFDALFQPQNHPARDAQDTFFIRSPGMTLSLPGDYVNRVKQVHENGGDTGSIGYRYQWKLDDAFKNVLRTHTTSVSTRMLYKLANQVDSHGHKIPFHPVKWFSIDRVFRNETLDATHLAEFHQVEGVVADYELTLSDLIGTIEQFFNRIGISNLRFKPAYNPYTEPSMEIFGYSEQLSKWMEIGMFISQHSVSV